MREKEREREREREREEEMKHSFLYMCKDNKILIFTSVS